MSIDRPFSNLTSHAVQGSFKDSLYLRIAALERRASIVRVSSLGVIFAASIAALAYSGAWLAGTVASSGFSQYVSLAFYDGAALAFTRELGLSILESLPVFGIALSFAAALAAAWSLHSFFDAVRHSRFKDTVRLA